MIKLPPNNQWSKNPNGDSLGSIYAEFGLDFTSNLGKIRVSPRTKITTDDITNLGVAIGFVRFNDSSNTNGYYAVAGDRYFNTASVDPSLAFSASSGSPTAHNSDTADIIFFKKANRMISSMQTTFSSNNGSGFATVGGTPLTGDTVHMMCEFGNRLYCTDASKTIISADTSMSVTASGNPNTFSLGTLSSSNAGLFFTDILSDSNKIWALTATAQYGEFAIIYTWDGASQDNPTNKYVLDCGGAIAGVIKDDTLYIMTVEAELLYFNGGTFVRVPNGKLPVDNTKFLKNSFSTTNNRWIHPNGMIITNEGKINILINNEYEDGTIEENMPSGVWEFDLQNPSLGWYNKLPLSLYSASVTDYGQNRVSRVGGLAYVKTPNKNGTLLIGAQLYSDATNTKEVIETNDTADTLQKYGYYVSPKIYSNQLKDSFSKLFIRIKKFLSLDDRIWLKYRTSDPEPTEVTINWITESIFRTTTDVSGMEGYEVEILQGTGGGFCSHITSIEDFGTEYEVTVDESYPNVSGTAKARIQNWKKAGEPFASQEDKFTKFPMEVADTWFQFKVCALLTGKNEIDDFILVNSTHTKAE